MFMNFYKNFHMMFTHNSHFPCLWILHCVKKMENSQPRVIVNTQGHLKKFIKKIELKDKLTSFLNF